MTILANLSLNDVGPILKVVQQSLQIRTHYELFNWLQEDIQHFMPHDIVIAAWGDFSLGLISYDIVSPIPGLRTEAFDNHTIQPFIATLFNRWMGFDHIPFAINSGKGFDLNEARNPDIQKTMKRMRCALVHGIKDQRGRHDCLYVLLGPEELGTTRSKETFRFLMPYLDTSFRQIAHLPEQYLHDLRPMAPQEPTLGFAPVGKESGLSTREHDIMEWVRKGKTNQEIGMILDISTFTVKNHLQRIFKKLDVMNRAQAVSKMEGPRATRN